MAVLVGCAVLSASADLLCVLPALLFACVLFARRYPGERALIALHARRRLRWPRARSAKSARLRPITVAVHGGALIGCSLAVRPPPALSRTPA
jgi:hypothetical protein